MRRFSTSLLCASALVLGAVACSDDADSSEEASTSTTAPEGDGATTLAQGEDVELVGTDGIGAQTLTITAEEVDGEVTGELVITDVVVTLQCADTATDGVVIIGGEVTEAPGDPGEMGGLLALIIREGEPDSVALIGNSDGAETCTELLEAIPEDGLTDDSQFSDVEAGSDIETG